jgi:septal ring factor EnvC (AmiA/AmiB activator)
MNAIPFDTLKFVRALRDKAKLPPEQAEGFADAIAEAVQSDLATKSDLQATRTDLKTELQAVRTDLKAEIQTVRTEIRETELRLEAKIESVKAETKAQIEASKAEILKWMFGTVGFQTILILGAVAALARFARP